MEQTAQDSRTVQVTINQLTKRGNGLGGFLKAQDKFRLVEVPFTIPGDVVRVYLKRKRGGIFDGRLEEILTPSPDRIQPRCVHFGVCGGCRLQQITHDKQLQFKENFVRSLFTKLLTEQSQFMPILPAIDPWQYRNKMEYTFSSDSSGKKYLGLIMDSSRGQVFNLTECHLTRHWFVDGLKSVRQWWQESGLDAYHMHHDKGSLRTLIMRKGERTGDRMVVLTVSGNPDFALKKSQLESFVAFVRAAIEPINPTSYLSIFLRIQQIGKGMATNMYEMLLYGPDHIRESLQIQVDPKEPPRELAFHISPSAFFQPNSLQAERLYAQALRLAEIPKDAVVYDLYCGTGTLGLCIAPHVKQVIGVELSPESALDARQNAQRNNCSNMTIFTGAVHHVLGQISNQNLPLPDVVMVDPPRPGLDKEVIDQIVAMNPKKILYISCNPVTQAENIADFTQQGYRIVAMQPVDQFPQTYHVENIAVLAKESS